MRVASLFVGLITGALALVACRRDGSDATIPSATSVSASGAAPSMSAMSARTTAPRATTASAPVASSAPLDTSCTKDSECTPAPGCCPTPCTARVINVKDEDRANAELHCDPAQKCFSVGGCRTHAYVCLRQQCALVFEGDADFRPRKP